ncbi:MAG: sigma-70 family RNA polymerase sigma factor [Candidatus Poribacteria bacterium]|nr:sigma-70 family RNA polymerase sigma factor [Candidatus Poribacteria bacterium]
MTIKVDDVSINRQFLETDDEEEACELLFNTYHEPVFAKISGMMRNHPDPAVGAEDIVQETFIKAFKERKTLREPEKLRGWLLTIATNLTLNEIRNAKKRRQAGDSPLESIDNPSIGESEVPYATSLAETDAEQAEAERYLVRQFLCLLQGKDRKVAELKDAGAGIEEIAEIVGPNVEAVQKRWERILEWLIPIALNLDALVNCLPEEKDRWVMERYLDEQSLSEIAEAIVGISRSEVEETVKRVRKQWKKAAKENPTDPVSAMVDNEN